MYLKKNPPLRKGARVAAALDRKPPRVLATSLGPICSRYAPFAADSLDQPTLLNGALYRFARETPTPEPELLEEFRQFVRLQVRLLFDKIQKPVDYEHDYLDHTHYNLTKKSQLLDLHKNMLGVPTSVVYKSFGKTEFINLPPLFQMAEDICSALRDLWATVSDAVVLAFYKSVRCINGPENRWKAYVAHLIHAVEKVVCKHPAFAKYIPVMERPAAIVSLLSKYPPPYYVTDYTSFEASFCSEILRACEGELYSYMLEDFSECPHIIKQMCGSHKCKFRDFSITLPGVRMSGDSNTSLGNGFTNLMLMKFMCEKTNIVCEGFVEGDDGLFAFSGEPDFSIITRLGFDLKFEPHATPYTSSFCGLLLSRSLASFTEPLFEIIKFGWSMSTLKHSTKKKVRLGLLRAKALSLFYCHPRCPMLTALAVKYIALTQGVEPIFSNNYWERKIVDETIKFGHAARLEYEKGITIEDRIDFAGLFHIDVPIQKAFEEYIMSEANFGPLDHWSIDLITAEYPHYAWMMATHVY